MRDEISPQQLDLWLAMYALDPWGDAPLIQESAQDNPIGGVDALRARLGLRG